MYGSGCSLKIEDGRKLSNGRVTELADVRDFLGSLVEKSISSKLLNSVNALKC